MISHHTVLSLHVLAGTSIERAAGDAQHIADLLGVGVDFTFNDVMCLAVPKGASAELERQYQVQIRRKDSEMAPRERRFARSYP